jgi:hypothetical protein
MVQASRTSRDELKRRNRVVLDRFKRRVQALVDGHEFEALNLFSGQYEEHPVFAMISLDGATWRAALAHRRRQLPKLESRAHSADLALRVRELRFADLSELSQAVKCARRFD